MSAEVAEPVPGIPPSDLPRPPPPIVEKTPPRPAPTQAYSWTDYNPAGKVIYVRSHEQANRVLAKLEPPTGPLGFDLEWKPTYVKGRPENRVSLVQLANNNCVMLFQVTAMKEFPEKLAEVLANPDIVKAGVAIQSDAKKLYNDWNVPVRNCVDLSLLARTADNARWAGKYHAPLGLAHLIETYEYKLLGKGKITRSNWEAVLSAAQQEYASNDAHAGYVLYNKLYAMAALMVSQPESSWFSFNFVAGSLCDNEGLPWTAQNPNYDPGPQPVLTEAQIERREKRKKERKNPRAGNSASTSSQHQDHAQPSLIASLSLSQRGYAQQQIEQGGSIPPFIGPHVGWRTGPVGPSPPAFVNTGEQYQPTRPDLPKFYARQDGQRQHIANNNASRNNNASNSPAAPSDVLAAVAEFRRSFPRSGLPPGPSGSPNVSGSGAPSLDHRERRKFEPKRRGNLPDGQAGGTLADGGSGSSPRRRQNPPKPYFRAPNSSAGGSSSAAMPKPAPAKQGDAVKPANKSSKRNRNVNSNAAPVPSSSSGAGPPAPKPDKTS